MKPFHFLAFGYLLLLLLFPPFRDGNHHLFNWHPEPDHELSYWDNSVGQWEPTTEYAGAFHRMTSVDLVKLGIESALGLLLLGLFSMPVNTTKHGNRSLLATILAVLKIRH